MQMPGEPFGGQTRHLVERSRFLEEVRGLRHDLEAFFALELPQRGRVERQHLGVVTPDDEERGGTDRPQPSAREVGAAARRLGIDLLVCVGRSATHTALGARGMPGLLQFPDVESAIPALRPVLRPGDCVLAKASRSSRLERIFEALKTESEDPAIHD